MPRSPLRAAPSPPVTLTVWLLTELFLYFTLYSSTFRPLSKVISQHHDNSVNPTPTHILVFQLKCITKKHYSSTRPSATLMQYTAVQLHFIQCHFAKLAGGQQATEQNLVCNLCNIVYTRSLVDIYSEKAPIIGGETVLQQN